MFVSLLIQEVKQVVHELLQRALKTNASAELDPALVVRLYLCMP